MSTEVASTDAKSRFLKSAAHLYSTSAPSTSAHLMLQHAEHAATFPDTRPRKEDGSICAACGTVLVLGWTSRITLSDALFSSQPATRSKSKKQKLLNRIEGPSSKYLTTECLICRRYTKRLFQPNRNQNMPRAKKPKSKQSSPVPAAQTTASPGKLQNPAPQNVSSKRRAKTRKQGGLRAMLDKSKATNQSLSGSGLEFVDLMRKL